MTIKELDFSYRDTGIPYEKTALSCPEDVVAYLDGAFDARPDQEQFWCIMLDRQNRPLCRNLCTIGTLSCSVVSPREIFKAAILSSAASIIVAHNHPSGDPAPSKEDRRATELLERASKVIGIEMIDHIIIGKPELDPEGYGFYSFYHGWV